MDEVAAGGEPVVITMHGKPVERLIAHRPPRAKSLIGLDRGRLEILGDIISSPWEDDRDTPKQRLVSTVRRSSLTSAVTSPRRVA